LFTLCIDTCSHLCIEISQLYNQLFNIVRICEYWMLTWVGVCLVMIQSINDAQQSGLSALMFLMMPVAGLMGYLVADRRRQQLLDARPEELNSPEEFELKSRFLMADLITQLRRTSNDHNTPPSHPNSHVGILSPEQIQSIIQGIFVISLLSLFIDCSDLIEVCSQSPSHCTTLVARDFRVPPCFCCAHSFTFTSRRRTRWPGYRT
jgi:hypothetical protein